MVNQSATFDNILALVDYQQSGHSGICTSSRHDDYPTHSYLKKCINTWQCVDCEIHGGHFRRRASEMIYRAMSNLVYAGVGLWFVTIKLENSTGEFDHDWTVIAELWANLRRAWSRDIDGLQYVKLACIGKLSGKIHLHIVATSEPPSLAGLDILAQAIGRGSDDMKKDIRQVVGYLRKNMSDPAPEIREVSNRLSFSKHFIEWSNPALLHRQKQSSKKSTLLYISNGSMDGRIAFIPPLIACRICGIKLPHTIDYFHRNGKRLRKECCECWKIKNVVLHSNHRAKKIERQSGLEVGSLGRISFAEVKSKVDSAGMSDGWMDYWTNRIIKDWTIDHIEPLSSPAGKNTTDNLCITSETTNAAKGDMSLLQWLSVLAGRGYRHSLMPPDWKVTRHLPGFD